LTEELTAVSLGA